MTEQNKRVAIIGGTVLVVIILLLFFRANKAAVDQVVNEAANPFNLPAAAIAGGDFVYNSGPINIPGITINGERDMSIIGACCSDCNSKQSTFQDPYGSSRGGGVTINEGNRGNNVYNYAPPPEPAWNFGQAIMYWSK